MVLTTHYCHECGQDQPFSLPHEGTCPDTPDRDCPERACTGCGAARITGVLPWRAGLRELPPGQVA